jgi:hypothetical protein
VRSVKNRKLLYDFSFGTVSDVLKAPLKDTGKWTAKVKSVKQMTTACRLQLWNRNGRNEVKPCRIDFAGGDTNLYGYVLGDPVNFVDPEGLRKGFSNPAICILVANIETAESGIEICETIIDTAYNDIGKNDDYSKMCHTPYSGACKLGCVGEELKNNLIKACTGDGLDLRKGWKK